ncbi:hypothetical protein FNV61_29500 [Streptomyces sp. RLB3-6]|nr:hypothetical protein FNV61_29500 [Streptomyces sp. RLB3-6]
MGTDHAVPRAPVHPVRSAAAWWGLIAQFPAPLRRGLRPASSARPAFEDEAVQADRGVGGGAPGGGGRSPWGWVG